MYRETEKDSKTYTCREIPMGLEVDQLTVPFKEINDLSNFRFARKSINGELNRSLINDRQL